MEDNVKKYLDKVVDQLVSETTIDYENDRIFTPFSLNSFTGSLFTPIVPVEDWNTRTLLHRLHDRHCIDIYGLNEDEVDYVWGEYRPIIEDRLNNGR